MAATIPTSVESIDKASKKILPGTWHAQDRKDKVWTVISVFRDPAANEPNRVTYDYKYTKFLYTDGRNGIEIHQSVVGTDRVSGADDATRKANAAKGKTYKKVQKLLEESVTAKEESDLLYPPTGGVLPYSNTPTELGELGMVKWNPKPHVITRPPSFYTMANIGQQFVVSPNAEPGAITAALLTQQQYARTRSNITKLGKIYQNKSSAVALNGKKKLTEENVKAKDLWGFRFIYNPNVIKYGTTIDTNIDWQMQVQSASNFFSGNTVVDITLYLNRIIDMTTLKDPREDLTLYYPGGITEKEKNGILKRGTEYDLDFLYRCVNGKPGNTSLLTDQSLVTADFGYITGMPVWLQIHDNMRYRGSIASLNVDHVLFTESMIPILSIVNIKLLRYPELEVINKAKTTLTQSGIQQNTSETTDK